MSQTTVSHLARAAFCAGALLFTAAPQVGAQPNTKLAPIVSAPAAANADARSRNFVVTGTSAKQAWRIAERAEKLRTDLAKRWLGKELADWPSPCRLDLCLNQTRLSGLSTFDFNAPQASWAPVRVCLSGDLDGVMSNCLPHELTHTILADHFRRPVPRWADEGASILEEGDAVRQRFDKLAYDLGTRWQLFRLDYLFTLTDYPARIEVLYAQGYSVTKFLVARKDRPTFLAFLRMGMDGDWAGAANRYYQFNSLADMQEAWLDTMRQITAKK